MALRLEILLEAVDRLTGPLARVRASIGQVASAASRVGQGSGVGLLARSLGQVAAQAGAATSAVAGLAGRAALLGGAAATGGLLVFRSQFLGVAAQFETFSTILTTLEGDQARAAASMEWIGEFARRTPYELAQVVDAFVRLRGAGVDARQFLESVGNAAAARGRTLEQAAEAFNDAIMGEFERLKEFGIAASREGQRITLEYAVRGQQFRRVVDATNREVVASTLQAIWNAQYGGAMDNLSRTWSGMMSNLADAWSRFTLSVMNAGVFDWLKERLSELLARLDAMSADGTLQAWAERLAAGFIRAFEGMREFLLGTEQAPGAIEQARAAFEGLREWVGWLAERFGGANVALAALAVVFGGPVIAALAGLAASFITLGIVIAATPIGWLVAGIGLLAGAAVLLVRNWQPVAAFFEGLWDGITARFEAAWEAIRPITDAIGGALGRLTGSGEGALTQPAAQADRRARFSQRGALGGFPMPPGLDEMERNAANLAATAARPELRVDTGGTMRIVVEDNRVQVRGQPNNPATRYDVNQGLSMVGP